MTKTLSDKNDSGRIGGFMGFGESSDSDSDGPIDVEAGTKIPLTAKNNEVGMKFKFVQTQKSFFA